MTLGVLGVIVEVESSHQANERHVKVAYADHVISESTMTTVWPRSTPSPSSQPSTVNRQPSTTIVLHSSFFIHPCCFPLPSSRPAVVSRPQRSADIPRPDHLICRQLTLQYHLQPPRRSLLLRHRHVSRLRRHWIPSAHARSRMTRAHALHAPSRDSVHSICIHTNHPIPSHPIPSHPPSRTRLAPSRSSNHPSRPSTPDDTTIATNQPVPSHVGASFIRVPLPPRPSP